MAGPGCIAEGAICTADGRDRRGALFYEMAGSSESDFALFGGSPGGVRWVDIRIRLCPFGGSLGCLVARCPNPVGRCPNPSCFKNFAGPFRSPRPSGRGGHDHTMLTRSALSKIDVRIHFVRSRGNVVLGRSGSVPNILARCTCAGRRSNPVWAFCRGKQNLKRNAVLHETKVFFVRRAVGRLPSPSRTPLPSQR